MTLLEEFNANYSERYFSFALIFFKFKPNNYIEPTKDDEQISESFDVNPLAYEWPEGNLHYISKFSALISDDEKIDFQDLEKVYCLACIPMQSTITNRTWKEADECSFALTQDDFPFDPSNIRFATTFIYQGVKVNNKFIDESLLKPENNLLDFSSSLKESFGGKYPIEELYNNLKNQNFNDGLALRDFCLKFSGHVDNISTDISSDNRVVNFKCRDITGALLDQTIGQEDFKKIADMMISNPIENVLRKIFNLSSAGKGLILHGIGFAPNSRLFPKSESSEVVKKNSKSRINKDMSYWDLVIDLCQLCGLTCQIEYLQQNKNLLSFVDFNKYICIPTLSIYTSDIAYGAIGTNETDIMTLQTSLTGKEFYYHPIYGVQLVTDVTKGHYSFWNSMPWCYIGLDGYSASITKDIGNGNIPSVRVISYDLEGNLVEGWYPPEKMFNKIPGDITQSKYNKKLRALSGVKYWDPKAYKEITVPGTYFSDDCERIAKDLFQDMIRGQNKLTINSSRYFFPTWDKNVDSKGMVQIGNIRAGNAIAVSWPIIKNNDIEEIKQNETYFVDFESFTDKNYSLLSSKKEQMDQIWYVTSVEYDLTNEGFEATIECVNSWDF